MEDINRVVIAGELVGDSTFSCAAGGAEVTTFTLSFSSDTGKQRNVKRKKGFIGILFLGTEARRWAVLLKKGTQVVVEGRLQQRSWITLEGIKKSKTEIIAQKIKCCNSSGEKREVLAIK